MAVFAAVFALLSTWLVYAYTCVGVLTVVLLLTALVVLDIQRRRVQVDQPFKEASRHYFTLCFLSILGYFMHWRLIRRTKNVEKLQEETLLKQLKANSDTEYGRLYKFSSITSVDEYLKSHPLTRYSHFEPYIERMVKGETQILTADQPTIFGVTSGTSGKSNILPMLKKQGLVFLTEGVAVLYDCMITAFPTSKNIQKNLKFFYNPKWRESASGIQIGPNSSTPARQESLLHMYTTPRPAFKILSEPEALYVYLLFALKDRTLGMIEANFSSLIFNAFRTMEERWNHLVTDIEQGRLNQDLNIDGNIRNDLNALMTPDPARAEELRQAYKDGIVGLGRRIWPIASLAVGADTGTFEFYGKKLRETYLKDIPLYSPIYGASEGLIGVNIWPTSLPSRYLLVPSAHFYEFIPVEQAEEAQPDTLLLHQVEEGEEYEVVITNLSCLYRYRFGDVVRVTGFLNQCPIVEFRYRQGQFLNVRGEKTSESAFYSALSEAVIDWSDVRLTDYCCTESIYLQDAGLLQNEAGVTPCYHVFLEIDAQASSQSHPTVEQIAQIDATLFSQSYVYQSFRKKGSIGPMKIHFVRQGTFVELRRFMVENTQASLVQYKVPRVLKKQEALKFMIEHVES